MIAAAAWSVSLWVFVEVSPLAGALASVFATAVTIRRPKRIRR